MINIYSILSFFILFNLVLLIYFSKIKLFHINMDKPDKIRKFHSKPTPLAGGQILFVNILIYWIVLNLTNNVLVFEPLFQEVEIFNYFMFFCSIVFILGFVDDRRNLKPNFKFLILSSLILILLLFDKDLNLNHLRFSFNQSGFFLGKFSIFFSIFCFLVFMNAFNMFDGINLQSSSYALFIFFNFLIFFSDSLIIKILIITLIFFIYLNLKNRSFLGDSGSLLLAFIISYFFVKFYNISYIKYADNVALYMIVPGLDLIRLFILRILKKRNPLSSDRMHIHHLLNKKYTQTKTLIIIFLLVCFPIILDYLGLNNIFTIFITITTYSFLIAYISERR